MWVYYGHFDDGDLSFFYFLDSCFDRENGGWAIFSHSRNIACDPHGYFHATVFFDRSFCVRRVAFDADYLAGLSISVWCTGFFCTVWRGGGLALQCCSLDHLSELDLVHRSSFATAYHDMDGDKKFDGLFCAVWNFERICFLVEGGKVFC